jgi:putative redox protein
MTAIQVTHLANSHYQVAVGRHRLTVDQPETAGGDDQGPAAVQLFAASLVACTAYYTGSYLTRPGLSTEGLVVEGDVVMADDSPARVVSLSVTITPT